MKEIKELQDFLRNHDIYAHVRQSFSKPNKIEIIVHDITAENREHYFRVFTELLLSTQLRIEPIFNDFNEQFAQEFIADFI